jgi:hypothetical protein
MRQSVSVFDNQFVPIRQRHSFRHLSPSDAVFVAPHRIWRTEMIKLGSAVALADGSRPGSRQEMIMETFVAQADQGGS